MPFSHVEQISGTWPNGEAKVTSSVYRDYNVSPRVNGKLRLQANQLNAIHKAKLITSDVYGGFGLRPPDARNGAGAPPGLDFKHVDNIAYNRWRGKLFKGGASLGVTAASWRQSRDMIVSRSNHVAKQLDNTLGILERNPKAVDKRRRMREPLANQILETEFGWRPLFEDVYAALTTVCKGGIPDEWVGGVGRDIIDIQGGSTSNPYYFHSESWSGQIRTSYATKVSIVNPNLWLLNRLGLINPATVVWDLVPWSFVVNMFLNVNSLLNSVTDSVGLNVTDMSITRTWKAIHEYSLADKPSGASGCRSAVNGYMKTRTVGVPLKPTLEGKIPELNWELALIASSLVVQKFKKINNLIRLL